MKKPVSDVQKVWNLYYLEREDWIRKIEKLEKENLDLFHAANEARIELKKLKNIYTNWKWDDDL